MGRGFNSEAPEEWTQDNVHHSRWEYAVWALLEFWLFAFNKNDPVPSLNNYKLNVRFFREAFYARMDKFSKDGTYSECLQFIPEDQEQCVPA